jgi:hypothetical protein
VEELTNLEDYEMSGLMGMVHEEEPDPKMEGMRTEQTQTQSMAYLTYLLELLC